MTATSSDEPVARLGHGEHWPRRAVPWILVLLFLFQFLVAYRADALAWDGVFYYSYVRSAILDGDLELSNDIALSYEVTPGQDFVSEGFHLERTSEARTANPFAVGTALLWLPWYAAAVAVGRATRMLSQSPGGYEALLRWTMGAVTAVYGFLAVLASYRIAERQSGRWAAIVASAVAMFATPLLYYQFREPFFAHAASALAVALFVASWWKGAEKGPHVGVAAFLLGALGGLAALVRTQNIVYLVLPLATNVGYGWRALRRGGGQPVRESVTGLASVALGALTTFSIQMATWRVLYGEWFVIPQGQNFMEWRAPWLGPVLLSSFKGLVPWMPIILPALVGLIVLAVRRRRLGVPLLVAVALQVYVNASASDWFGGGGYGPRRFSGLLVLVVLGCSVVADLRRDVAYRATALGVGALLVIHQWLLVSRGFAAGIGGQLVRMSAPVEWTEKAMWSFLAELAGYLPAAVGDGVSSVVLSDSPLDIATTRPSHALVQAGLLALVCGVLWGTAVCWARVRGRVASNRGEGWMRWLGFATTIAAAVAVGSWILLRA